MDTTSTNLGNAPGLSRRGLAGGPGLDDRSRPRRGCPRSLAFGDRGYRYNAKVDLNSNAEHGYRRVARSRAAKPPAPARYDCAPSIHALCEWVGGLTPDAIRKVLKIVL